MRLKNTSQEFRIQNTFNKLHPIAHNSIYVKFVLFLIYEIQWMRVFEMFYIIILWRFNKSSNDVCGIIFYLYIL